MRRPLLIALVTLLLLAGALFAQEETTDEDRPVFYAMTVYINTVYLHDQGYVIDYNDSELYAQRAYLPFRWFTAAAGKGEIIYGTGDQYPYMMVYYENGAFSHLRLYVADNPFDMSWDQLPASLDLEQEFSVEEPQLNY